MSLGCSVRAGEQPWTGGRQGRPPCLEGLGGGLEFLLNSKSEVSVVSLISRCALWPRCRQGAGGLGQGWGPGG